MIFNIHTVEKQINEEFTRLKELSDADNLTISRIIETGLYILDADYNYIWKDTNKVLSNAMMNTTVHINYIDKDKKNLSQVVLVEDEEDFKRMANLKLSLDKEPDIDFNIF